MSTAINKEKLAQDLSNRVDISKTLAKETVEALFEIISQGLIKKKKVHVVGFGSFEVRQRKARMGRNPKTGAKLPLPAMKTPCFTPSEHLKNAVRGK